MGLSSDFVCNPRVIPLNQTLDRHSSVRRHGSATRSSCGYKKSMSRGD